MCVESSRRCLHSTGQLRCVDRTLRCAQNSYVWTELLCVQRTLKGVDSADVCIECCGVHRILMCAQNAEVCTELKQESVTAVKPRKSKRGFSHAVAHNMRRTRIPIKGNEPIFDIRPSIKMSTFSYEQLILPSSAAPAQW